MTLYKKDKKDMVTDISFSKHARRQIGKYIKGTYHKQLSNALNKQIHIYSPQKLLKTLQQAKILPKLRQIKGSYTLEPRNGLFLQIIKTLRYNFEYGAWTNKMVSMIQSLVLLIIPMMTVVDI